MLGVVICLCSGCILELSKPLTRATFTQHRVILLRCTHLGRDWLLTRSAVAGATFMNEFAPYAMQAPPFNRRTGQRFTEFDYSSTISYPFKHVSVKL